jgi:hypothetical protein
MNSSIYCSQRDPAERTSPFVLMSRFCGAISLSGHISHWTKEHVREVKRYLDGFKRFRHLLMMDFHRLASYPRSPEDWDVVQFMDPESGEAVILAYRCAGSLASLVATPKRLKKGAVYAVTDPFSEEVLESEKGEKLLQRGLSLELPPHSAVIRHLKVAAK